jgi:hypothetical protein
MRAVLYRFMLVALLIYERSTLLAQLAATISYHRLEYMGVLLGAHSEYGFVLKSQHTIQYNINKGANDI